MSTVISVEQVSKAYRLGQIGGGTLKEDVSRWWAKLQGKPDPTLKIGQEHHARLIGEQFWALDKVSFEVKEGEVLGIIGRNGAGKSTLLKILSQVTTPTSGQIKIKGRIASLLEVGTGFHPELTGRENIFLNGAILGMTKAEIRKKFDEIVAFSGVEEFIDTPVKRYSSGMYVRLAFAVAAHLEPEILIVDEVLAVGDAEFQKKCLGKMGEVAKGGRTVLFVSHNLQAVQILCTNTVLLDSGCIVGRGEPSSVINEYLKSTTACNEPLLRLWPHQTTAIGNERIRIRRLAIVTPSSQTNGPLRLDTPFAVEVEYWNLAEAARLSLCIVVYAGDGTPVFESLTEREANWHNQPFPTGLFRSSCAFPAPFLNEGTYRLRILFTENLSPVFNLEEALTFTIIDNVPRNSNWFGRYVGHVRPSLEWKTELLPQGTI
jgi:lipopolysaccharide transport system ATP-binding protein